MRSQAREKPPTNPTLAAILSMLLPGLGQFYNRDTKKGLGFLFGIVFFGMILIGGHRMLRHLTYNQFDAEIAGWNEQDLFFTVGPFLIGCIVWSVVDAFQTARGPR